ncbi:ZZ-type zinc finger-containing protein 3, partial [Dissostichus eleginoides]
CVGRPQGVCEGDPPGAEENSPAKSSLELGGYQGFKGKALYPGTFSTGWDEQMSHECLRLLHPDQVSAHSQLRARAALGKAAGRRAAVGNPVSP